MGKSIIVQSFYIDAFALSGRNSGGQYTQGDALGYVLVPLQGVP